MLTEDVMRKLQEGETISRTQLRSVSHSTVYLLWRDSVFWNELN